MEMQPQTLPLNGLAQDAPSLSGDHLLVAEMVEPGSQGARRRLRRGRLVELLETRGIDGRGMEISREGVDHCVAKGLAVVQGDADTDLARLSRRAFDYVILSKRCRRRGSPAWCWRTCCGSGHRHRLGSPISDSWRMRLQSVDRRSMPRTENLPATWSIRANIHFCTIRDFVRALRRDQRRDGARGRARSPWPSVAGQSALVVLEPVRRAGRVVCSAGRGRGNKLFTATIVRRCGRRPGARWR